MKKKNHQDETRKTKVREICLLTGLEKKTAEGMADRLKMSGPQLKPDPPDQEGNQSIPSGIQPPSTGELERLFSSSNSSSPPPHLAAWSPAMPGPRRVSQETHVHLDL